MRWLNIFTWIVVISASSAKLLAVETENQLISSYINALIKDLQLNDRSTHDVVMIQFNKFGNLNQRNRNILEDIRRAIPDSTPVHFPPVNKVIEDRNLRVASLNIIVSDLSNPVSKYFWLRHEKCFHRNHKSTANFIEWI